MGVKGLWQLLLPIGRRISIETLEGKVLAVDASIWLTQFLKAMRDQETGRVVPNAHLMGFLRRLCKLLYHGIRPVMVFDGATPAIKKLETERRRKARGDDVFSLAMDPDDPVAQLAFKRMAKRLLLTQLKKGSLATNARTFNPSNKNTALADGVNLPENDDGEIVEDNIYEGDKVLTFSEVIEDPNNDDNLHILDTKSTDKNIPDAADPTTYNDWEIAKSLQEEEYEDDVNGEAIIRSKKSDWDESEIDVFDDDHKASESAKKRRRRKGRRMNRKRARAMQRLETSDDDLGSDLDQEETDNGSSSEHELNSKTSLSYEAIVSAQPSERKDIFERAQREQRLASRKNFMPVAANPDKYSQAQVTNFLKSSRLNSRIRTLATRISQTSQGDPAIPANSKNGKLIGEAIASDSSRRIVFSKGDDPVMRNINRNKRDMSRQPPTKKASNLWTEQDVYKSYTPRKNEAVDDNITFEEVKSEIVLLDGSGDEEDGGGFLVSDGEHQTKLDRTYESFNDDCVDEVNMDGDHDESRPRIPHGGFTENEVTVVDKIDDIHRHSSSDDASDEGHDVNELFRDFGDDQDRDKNTVIDLKNQLEIPPASHILSYMNDPHSDASASASTSDDSSVDALENTEPSNRGSKQSAPNFRKYGHFSTRPNIQISSQGRCHSSSPVTEQLDAQDENVAISLVAMSRDPVLSQSVGETADEESDVDWEDGDSECAKETESLVSGSEDEAENAEKSAENYIENAVLDQPVSHSVKTQVKTATYTVQESSMMGLLQSGMMHVPSHEIKDFNSRLEHMEELGSEDGLTQPNKNEPAENEESAIDYNANVHHNESSESQSEGGRCVNDDDFIGGEKLEIDDDHSVEFVRVETKRPSINENHDDWEEVQHMSEMKVDTLALDSVDNEFNDDWTGDGMKDPNSANAALEQAQATASNLTNWAGRAFRRAMEEHMGTRISPQKTVVNSPNHEIHTSSIVVDNDAHDDDDDANKRHVSQKSKVTFDIEDHNSKPTAEGWRESYNRLEAEVEIDRLDSNRAQRDMETMTDDMKEEIMQLLQLFGVPYVEAPAEAEAQCVALEQLGLVNGIVTEDSDVFVFGGKQIYKNIFDEKKYVEVYHASDAEKELDLSTNDMVALAMLMGGDYTAGVKGVGIVNGMEILQAFPVRDDLKSGLADFRKWLDGFDPSDALEEDAAVSFSHFATPEVKYFHKKHRSARTRWIAPADFPSPNVLTAYTKPVVDRSRTPLSWGIPDLENLRSFCRSKMGWEIAETDKAILPVIEQMKSGLRQTRLDSFFMTYKDDIKFAQVRSERLRTVIHKVQKKNSKKHKS